MNFLDVILNHKTLGEQYRELTEYIEYLQMSSDNSIDKKNLIEFLEKILRQVTDKMVSKINRNPLSDSIKELIIPVDLIDYCGKWICKDFTISNGNDTYFDIIAAGEKFYISFDDSNATLHELSTEEEDVFIFYIGEQWHKLCVNTSCKELSIVSFNDFKKY